MGSSIIYITEKAAHQHVQDVTFGLCATAWLISWPTGFISTCFYSSKLSRSKTEYYLHILPVNAIAWLAWRNIIAILAASFWIFVTESKYSAVLFASTTMSLSSGWMFKPSSSLPLQAFSNVSQHLSWKAASPCASQLTFSSFKVADGRKVFTSTLGVSSVSCPPILHRENEHINPVSLPAIVFTYSLEIEKNVWKVYQYNWKKWKWKKIEIEKNVWKVINTI